jgi:phenylpropionate dioxygenase-like ring-hydroxylating dioxygenase large terminal subunit
MGETFIEPPRRIERRIYVDGEIFDQESRKVFARTWQYVGHANELKAPGDFRCATIGGQPVVVFRDDEFKLRAFFNTCAHRGAELTGGPQGNLGRSIRCMYHGWTYDLRGGLIGVPYREAYGPKFDREAHGLKPVHVDAFSGLMFVSVEPETRPLEDYLGEAAPYLRKCCENTEVIGRIRWMYDGNWKLWHENFADNYHPEFTHYWVRDAQFGYANDGENRQLDPGHGLLSWPQQPLHLDRLATGLKKASSLDVDPSKNPEYDMPPFPIDETAPDFVLTVFPNLDLQYFFGGAVVILEVETPMAVDRTLVEMLSLAPIGEPPDARRWRLERSAGIQASSGKISADDTEALARCQRGAAARATPWSNLDRGQAPGKLGQSRDEYSLRSFYAEWQRCMAGA